MRRGRGTTTASGWWSSGRPVDRPTPRRRCSAEMCHDRPMPSARTHLSRLAVVAVVGLAVVGCGESGDDSSPTTTTTETAQDDSTSASGPAGGEDAATDPYDGHTSDVYDDGRGVDLPARPRRRRLPRPRRHHRRRRRVEPRSRGASPPPTRAIDCFYVYPTVSPGPRREQRHGGRAGRQRDHDRHRPGRPVRPDVPGVRPDLPPGDPERASAPAASPRAGRLAYGDVVDAWKTYISTWNEGRGVILIGHSQGTGHLKKLIAEEVDGNDDLMPRLVAAHLFGGAVQVPEGEVVGGDFQDIPACEAADQTGCVVTWSSYPADHPPAPDAIFGAAGGDPSARATAPPGRCASTR